MEKEILQLYKDVSKLIGDLDYDKRENERLRFNIEHMLEIDISNDHPKTLIDRLFRFSLWRTERYFDRFRKRKFKHIRSAIRQNDDAYLYNSIYNNTSLFELRKSLADQRYDTKDLLDNPGSSLAVGTIVDSYFFIDGQFNSLQTIADEVKSHLDNKYSNEIDLNI